MEPLPREFLTKIADKYSLSAEQEEAFVALYGGSGENRFRVADSLHITESALNSRMTGIYRKFNIGENRLDKFRHLGYVLAQQYDRESGTLSRAEILEDIDVDALSQQIRERLKFHIRQQCGTMKILDMTQPIALTGEGGIYTNVNILERISGRQRRGIEELLSDHSSDSTCKEFDRFGLAGVVKKQIPGLDAVERYQRLMVLGKPGAGKTTFLKFLAMQCIEGHFLAEKVPIFITLKNFAESPEKGNLTDYIAQQLSDLQILDPKPKIQQLLSLGRAFVLLDGLDEVREEDTAQVLTAIRETATQFYANQFVMTCRIAAKEYTFEQFTEVEVADFQDEQIQTFAQNWFRVVDPKKAERFIQKLADHEPIKELATNPLLLTLLCLVFGENGDFPANRSELYKEGLDVLLKKWDAKRNIERNQVYKKLSLKRKEDLLSQIALTAFKNKDYFVKQKTIEHYISDFIRVCL